MNSSETDQLTTAAPGALLGAAREAQSLGIADVARQLKLTVHQVEALETGDYEKLPGPVFVRGFIRNYARLVKLDPEELVRAAVQRLPHEEPRPAAPPSHDIPFPTAAPRRWPLYAGVTVAVIVALLAAYEFYFSESQPARGSVAVPPPAPVVAPPVPRSAPESASETPGSGGAGTAEPTSVQPAPSAVPASAPPAAPEGIQRAPADAGKSGMGEPDLVPGRAEREVRMVFEQESWVEIRDRSGKPVFSQLNRRGTEKRVNARPPLSIVVGNAHGVRFSYDDQMVDLSQHTKVDVARFNLE